MSKANLEKELDQAFEELCTLLVDYDNQELFLETIKKVVVVTYRLGQRRGFETVINHIKKLKEDKQVEDSFFG